MTHAATRHRPSLVAAGALLALGAAAPVPAARPTARPHPTRLHLALRRAEPAADGTVATPPRVLRLWFSEAPELAVTTVRLVGPTGAVVPTGTAEYAGAEDAPVVVPIRPVLAAGRYRVEWRTMARDGHVQRGAYAFAVARPAASR